MLQVGQYGTVDVQTMIFDPAEHKAQFLKKRKFGETINNDTTPNQLRRNQTLNVLQSWAEMASRKRSSDTVVVNSTSEQKSGESNSRLRVRIRRFHGVAKWTWNAGSDDEVCGICQSAFEGVAPGIKYPGDECPVVFGKCGHAFHLQCVATWLNSSRQTCPICRREWEYGQSSDQRRSESN